jgi:hypothetical protein
MKTAEGRTSLRGNLSTDFYKELVGKSASTGAVVNAILHHLCTDPSLSCYHIGGMDCPASYQKALKSPQQAEWRASMNEEIEVLWRQRKCWTAVKIPVGI